MIDSTEATALLDRFKQSEYTGANRCIPCTVVNALIAVAVSLAIALVTVPGAIAAFVLFVALIYLRGYLVPYTPTLTKRYLPDRILRKFDKGHATSAVPTSDEGLVDVESFLYSLDVLTERESGNDLRLVPTFRDTWRQHMTALEAGTARRSAIASLLDVDRDKLAFQEFGSAVLVRYEGKQVGQWESEAALLADLAADSTLAEWDDRWPTIDVANRSRILNTLRMFLETCPDCGGPTRFGQETVESCCRSIDVVAVTCNDCHARLFELEMSPSVREAATGAEVDA